MASLPNFLIGVLVFLVFIIGGMFFVQDMESSYDIDMGVDEYINDTYLTVTDQGVDFANETTSLGNTSYDISKDVQGRMLDKQVDETDTESSLFSGAFSVFRLIPTSINLINNVMNQMAIQIGIPTIFVQIGFSALIIVVIFSIVFLIFRVGK